MSFALTPRERRWLNVVLILAAVTLAFVVLGYLANALAAFGDLILVFFLAWLLAFIISPLVARLSIVPFMSRAFAVVLIYVALFGGLVVVIVASAAALAGSVADFLTSVPTLERNLPAIVAPWQDRLVQLGLGRIDLMAQASAVLDNLDRLAGELAGPLQQIAVASLGTLANLLLIVILSLYMVADRDHMLAFLFRLVPPRYKDDARVLTDSISRSFGGFLRGQALMGVTYGLTALIASTAFGLDYTAVTAAVAGVLMAIPFFGPFVAWGPPVLVALVTAPSAMPGTLVVMALGWLIVMNVLQPRIMSESLRIHPIVVLGSVLVGAKIAGIGGAIFGIPIAAVGSALFFHWLERSVKAEPVAARAARRLEAREGGSIRVPREPDPATDTDVEAERSGHGVNVPPGRLG
jgi:predicted PurR-regulated permease PerM